MEYFKDISDYLTRKYPDRKVFVISDEHFDHKNIINHTRSNFISSDIDSSVNNMNDYIIANHNSVVSNDDIVLILGDYSFKTGIDRLALLTSKLNGHKFLVLGNHDNLEKPDSYLKVGFEDVFLNPIKFNGDYYSHYPLNSKEDRPNTILYKYLSEEFKKDDEGVNFHGHQHELINNGKNEKNVSCEQVDYKPLFVGRTKSYLENNNLPYINEELFTILHDIMAKFHHYQESNIITDYLYTILLELLTPYQDEIVAFGSLMLNKKYNTNFNPSDLDITKLYDTSKGTKTNKRLFMDFGNDMYKKMAQVEGFNPDFYKKIDFICILSFIYLSKNHRIKGFIDMHMLFDEFYKSDDFINIEGKSLLEESATRMGITKPSTIKYPRFNIKTTNALADIANCFLQYIYITDNEKKSILLKKLNKLVDKVDISSKQEFEELQNMLIRFLLRNIYFYERSRRKTESDIVLTKKDIIVPKFTSNNNVEEALTTIINNQEYNKILDTINKSNNRKEAVTRILKNYK